MTEIKINEHITNCQHCIFSSEINCKLDLIKLYKEKGIKVTENDGHNILHDFYCPYGSSSYETLKKAIHKYNGFPYFIVLNRPKWKGITKTITQINRFTIKPNEVWFFVDANQHKHASLLIKKLKENAAFNWVVSEEYEDNTWTSIISKYNKRDFLLYCENLPQLNNDWAEKLSNEINNNLLKFGYATKDKAMLIPSAIYNRYYFEYTKNILDKIKEYLCTTKYEL